MTPLGWTVAAIVGAVALLGFAWLVRWLRSLEAERIEAVARRRGWRVDGGSGPSDWRVEGADGERRWVLGVRSARRGPVTEWTIALGDGPLVVFAAPGAASGDAAARWVREVFEVDAPAVAFVEGGPTGWVVAASDAARARALLATEEPALRALRPTLALRGEMLRLRLSDEVRDGPTLEALIDLGLRLARAR